MELLKRMNYEIVFIIATTIVAICTALPACTIRGERTFGGDNTGKRCTQNVSPNPKCATRPGGEPCPLIHTQCKLSCTGSSTCTVCSDASDACRPCRLDLVHCINQPNEDCYSE